MAKLHIVTGKGGVGKSTAAAALTRQLLATGRRPVLLVDVQGSGRALEWLGLPGAPFENRPLGIPGGFGSRILPKETFRQYFGKLLALGNETGTLASVTAGLRERVAEKVTDNKIVSAFIDVCPGLEPSVLLGKLHWEAAYGRASDSEPWSDVVVDAPATGHGLALFESVAALVEVFGSGLIFRQASEIMDFVRDPERTKFWIVALPEEVPVRETIELRSELERLRLPRPSLLFNRCRPRAQAQGESGENLSEAWREEVKFERERHDEQARLESELRTKLDAATFVKIPDFVEASAKVVVERFAAAWSQGGST